MDREDIGRAFKLLSEPTGCVHWTAKSPEHRATAGAYSCSAEKLVEMVQRQAGWDFYLSLNTTQNYRGAKPGFDNITHLGCIGIDIDPFPGQRLRVTEVADELERVTKQLLQADNCHIIIHSGRGVWLWILVQPVAITAAFPVEDADLFVKAVTHYYIESSAKLRELGIIDTASAEISRIARCPGTKNMRSGQLAYILLDREPESRISLASLGHLIPPFRERYTQMVQPSDLGLSDTDIRSVAPALNLTSRQFLLCGADKAVESRHRRLFSTAKNMQELGIPEDRAAALLALAASRCTPNLLKDDPTALPAVLKRLWRRSYSDVKS